MNLFQQLMLLALPLVLLSGLCGTPYLRALEPKARCWLVMMAASLATYAFNPVAGAVPFMAYACIDSLGCVAVSARRYFWPQRIIACGFGFMFLCDIVAHARGDDGTGWFQLTSEILGLAMWAVLLLWSLRDAGRGLRYHINRWWSGGVRDFVAAHLPALGRRGQR